MTTGINTHTVVGNLGADPVIRYSPSGQPRATFSVATSASWTDRDSGEKRERTDWHHVVLFGKLAEVAKYLNKGRQVYVEGPSRNVSWEHEGTTYYRSELHARTLQLLGAKAPAPNGEPEEAVAFDENEPAF